MTDIQGLDGLFLACRTNVARQIRFDPTTFDNFHGYDLDFTYRAFMADFRLAVCRDLFIVHFSHGRFDETWMKYRRRFEEKFAENIGATIPEAAPHLGHFLLDPKILDGDTEVARLCNPATLSAMLADVDRRYAT